MAKAAKLKSVESTNAKMHAMSHTVFSQKLSKKTLKLSPRKPILGGPKKGKGMVKGD